MSSTPNTNLQATPDFFNFYFLTKTTNGFINRRVRFRGRKGGNFYQVEFRTIESGIKDDPSWPQADELLDVALTLILIVEIYSERYPARVLRFFPNDKIEAELFGLMIGRFRYLLQKSFTIEWERQDTRSSIPTPDFQPTVIRRKPLPYFSMHTVESIWRGTSRIFNNEFNIELEKRVLVGLKIPRNNEF